MSWLPTWRALWSPKGQQVMMQTPAQPTKHYGIGAVNYHTGQTVVLVRRHKRRREIAELLLALLDQHPIGTVYVAWDNANTHEDDEVEAVVRGAAGRLVRPSVFSASTRLASDRASESVNTPTLPIV